MSTRLAAFVSVTDALMVLYWIFTACVQFGVLHAPADWMYAHYDQAQVVAWNWSFMPLDIAFSVFGGAAIAASRRGDLAWRPLALVSLVLTSTSGLMAVSYWIIAREFDATWFLTNLALMAWPLFFLPPLVKGLGQAARP